MDEPDRTGPAGGHADGDDPVVRPPQSLPSGRPQSPERSDQNENPRPQSGWYIPKRKRRKFKAYLRQFSRAGSDRHIELVIAAAVLVFVVLQYIMAGRSNQATSYQISKIITAANGISASANSFSQSANSIKTYAGQFSGSAAKINAGVGDAVDKLQAQADQIKRSADAAKSSAATAKEAVEIEGETVEISSRPWLFVKPTIVDNGLWFPVFPGGKLNAGLTIQFSIKNVGKTIAKNVQIEVKFVPRRVAIAGMMPSIPFISNARQVQEEACNASEKGDRTYNEDVFPVKKPTEETLGVSTGLQALSQTEGQIGSQSYVGFDLVGCISYHSSYSGTIHHTWFAYYLTGPRLRVENHPISIGFFEVGTPVKADQIQLEPQIFARNDAD